MQKTMIKDAQKMLDVIERRYGTSGEPYFEFVERSITEQPYARLLHQLSEKFVIEDITDVNYDVSFVFVLQQIRLSYILRLSMLGNYGLLMKSDLGSKGYWSISTENLFDSNEEAIIKALQKNNVELLDQETLELPVKIKLFNTAPEDVRVYQALFCDNDVLPWRFIDT